MRITQSKTSARVRLPLARAPHLLARAQEEIARQRARGINSDYLILSERRNRPYKSDHFKHLFARIRAAAAETIRDDPALAEELQSVCFLHLRHTAVTRLAEAGSTDLEISGVTDHTPGSIKEILRRYLVQTAELAESAFAKRHAAETRT